MPILTKSWTITKNETFNEATTNLRFREFLIRAKNAWVAGGAVIRGSGDTATGGMDGVDRWIDTGDLINGDPDRSWIVIEIANGFQICIYLQEASDLYAKGSYVGFTGGDEDTEPTATDEQILISNESLGVPAGDVYLQHVISSDSLNFRSLYCAGGITVAILAIETMINVDPSWSAPPVVVVATGSSGAGGGVRDAQLWSVSTKVHTLGHDAGAGYECAYTGETWGGSSPSAQFSAPSLPSSKTPEIQVGCSGNEATLKGPAGRIPDLWWGPDGFDGTLHVDGSSGYQQLGHLIVPWDSTTISANLG